MIPPEVPLYSATHVRNLKTGETFVACNCPNQPRDKTLRYVNNNRDKFEVVPIRRLRVQGANRAS